MGGLQQMNQVWLQTNEEEKKKKLFFDYDGPPYKLFDYILTMMDHK